MALARATPLLTTIEDVARVASYPDLANLEDDSELSIANTLLAAHEWVFDRLKRRFTTAKLLTITNQVELEPFVAYRALELLSATGLLGRAGGTADAGERDWFGAQAAAVDEWQPEFSAHDSPRVAGEGSLCVKNLTSDALFG